MKFLSVRKVLAFSLTINLLLHSFNLKAQTSCCADLVVSPEDLDKYVINYDNNFRGNNVNNRKIFTKWIFLHRNYILFIDSFLNEQQNQSYAGVKFFFVDNNTILDSDQQEHKNQLFIQISAAFSPRRSDENALLNFDRRVDFLWKPDNQKIYLSPSTGTSPNINTRINKYDILRINSDALSRHRSSRPANKYTKEVFICREIIHSIASELKTDINLGGVKCIFGSYNKLMQGCIGNVDSNQFTLIFAAVKDQNQTVKFLEYFAKMLKISETGQKFIDNYNHGSLCPNVCNQ
jgi:hypothetical protein